MATVPPTPIVTPGTWKAADLADGSWQQTLTDADREFLLAMVAAMRSSGLRRAELTAGHAPLGSMEAGAARWLEELEHGRGFVLIGGLPLDDLDDEGAELLTWGLGLHLGTAVSQSAAGDLLGHVRDSGADPSDSSVRRYRTSERLSFHSDGADIIGLVCLHPAAEGGESRLVSATAVYDEVARRRPDLAPLYFEHFPFDRNDEQREGEHPWFDFPLGRMDGERLATFYIGWYIRESQRHPEAPRLTEHQVALIDLIDAIAEDPEFHISMDLRRGDLQLARNAGLLHARTSFVDSEPPAPPRHLLRLWLAARHGFDDGHDILNMGIPEKDGVPADAEPA